MLNILVTGGYGFIGSAFIKQCLDTENCNILNIDSMTYAANKFNLRGYEELENYNFLELDICETLSIQEAISDFRPTWIVNFAAESHVDNSISSPDTFIKTNIDGVLSLLKASSSYFESIRKDKEFRLLHISTDEVFGDLKKDLPPAKEETAYNPSSPYSASKASSDHLVQAWARTYGLPVLLTNCSNNYGPNQHVEKFIPKIIHNSLNGLEIPVYDKGENIRDWIYVEDHVSCLIKILKKSKPFQRYNIGANNQLSNLDVLDIVLACIESQSEKKNLKDLIRFVQDRPGHDFRYAIDSSKAIKNLGWIPSKEDQYLFAETVKWYLNNEEFYE